MSEESAVSGGLLDGVEPEDQTTNSEPETTISHNADAPVEAAARPDWWPEKFWKKDENEADMENMAKSYAELEKKFRNGDHKPPEQYDQSLFEGMPNDDKLVTTYTEWAMKYGVTQDAYNELAQSFLDIAGQAEAPATAEDMAKYREAEMQKLGPNGDAIVKATATWGAGMVNKGIFSPEDYEEFKVMAGTADGIKVINKIRSAYEGKVPVSVQPSADAPSKDELESMVADPKYKTDAAFRSKVEKMFEKAYG